jgi:hypothetical protein
MRDNNFFQDISSNSRFRKVKSAKSTFSHIAIFIKRPHTSTLVHGNIYGNSDHSLIIKRRPRKCRAVGTHKAKLGRHLGRQKFEKKNFEDSVKLK